MLCVCLFRGRDAETNKCVDQCELLQSVQYSSTVYLGQSSEDCGKAKRLQFIKRHYIWLLTILYLFLILTGTLFVIGYLFAYHYEVNVDCTMSLL